MTPLHTAFSFPNMAHRARAVANDLHFNMPRLPDELLGVEPIITKGGLRLRRTTRKRISEFIRFADHAHAATSPACDGFEQHATVRMRREKRFGVGQRQRLRGPRQHGNAGILRDSACLSLITKSPQRVNAGSDKRQTGCFYRCRKVRVFTEETVTRMY